MILAPNYCWERVQKHQITLETQNHDLGTSIGTYIIGNIKNNVKKDQNYRFSDLSGGVYWNSSMARLLLKGIFNLRDVSRDF